MELDYSGIDKKLLKVLRKIQGSDLFNDFYLVGGTALSLQIGHRISEDIDLFTEKAINKEEILFFLENNFGNKINIKNNSDIIFQLIINNELKIDFVKYPYKLLEPLHKLDGIRLIGKKDLSAMKISAIGTRGDEAKDFVDIYYLLKEITIDDMFEYFIKKFKTTDIQHYKRSLIYFDDVTVSSWKSVKMIKEKLSITDIKKTITEKVAEYSQKQIRKR